MSTSLKHFILQGAILVSWAFLVILPLTNASVEAQITCPKLKYLAPIPGWSWYKDTEVTVKIDSSWTPSERSAIANGNAKLSVFQKKLIRRLNMTATHLMVSCIGNALTL
jgi:hypothetical protein